MKRFYDKLNYFSNGEKILWTVSVAIITVAFVEFDRANWLSYIASLIGVTSLLFAAKGNPFGMVLMIVFSAIYGYISYTFAYYGELITYVGMTLPMSVWSLVQWLRHPYQGQRSQVTVNARLSKKAWRFMAALTPSVTVACNFILSALGTANILPSTLSVTTSFAAVYLTGRRSPYYAVAYACNDVVLMILWTLAALTDRSYVNTVICFAAFLAGDIYGFISWKRMERAQKPSGSKDR
jgi:nicotinamide mononucleotide transporter PnuC